jgi:thiamine pyrophosphate-dependent acetolactate synthase large subunit-like protein
MGCSAKKISDAKEIKPTLQTAFKSQKTWFVEVIVKPLHEVIPPVPPWLKTTKYDKN